MTCWLHSHQINPHQLISSRDMTAQQRRRYSANYALAQREQTRIGRSLLHYSDDSACGISQLQPSAVLGFWSVKTKNPSENLDLLSHFLMEILKWSTLVLSPLIFARTVTLFFSPFSLSNLVFESPMWQYNLKILKKFNSISTLQTSTSPIICSVLFIITSSRLFSPDWQDTIQAELKTQSQLIFWLQLNL